MPKLPRITARELLRALERDGWRVSRSSGSHQRLVHPHREGKVTISMHPGVTVKTGTLRGILTDAGMSVERLRQLL